MTEKPIDRIRALDVAWGEAVARRDLDALVGLYAADGAVLWQGEPAHVGSDAIRAAWQTMLKTAGLALTFTPDRIDVSESGDMASDFGKVTMAQDTPAGRQTMVAKYLVVWKRVGDDWKVFYDSYNTSSEG